MEAAEIHGIVQSDVTLCPEPVLRILCGDAAAGIVFCDPVPGHKPGNPLFLRGSDGHRYITQFCQAAFKQADGVNRCQFRSGFQPAKHFLFDGTMGDAVQVQKGLFVGKDDGTQILPVQTALFYSSGEPGFNGSQHGLVG